MSTTPSSVLAVHHYPAKTTDGSIPLVLLHGWGCDSQTWQPLLDGLQQMGDVFAIDLPGFGGSNAVPFGECSVLLDLLEQHLPAQAVLVGWSLGGMLAVALAARAPEKVIGIVTLATNTKFVATSDYPAAMPRDTNRHFTRHFAADPHAALKLFSGLLAQGDANERALLKTLRSLTTHAVPNEQWNEALMLLAQLDNRAAFAQITQPGLHLLAEADVLVPVSAATTLQALNPQQQVDILPRTAHALHWSQPQAVLHSLRVFLQRMNTIALDKRKVAKSFSRAATTYDAVATLQRDVGHQLLQQLPAESAPHQILDLGCGTGFFSQALRQHFPAATIIGLDIAEGMLDFARTARGDIATWLCGDAEYIPLAGASVDLIFSSLAIQWCEDPRRLFTEIRRVLKPGGYALIATLGPDTLHELKQAWQQVDTYVHVNRFVPVEKLDAAIQNAHLTLISRRTEQRKLRYGRLVDLTRELKALGAHNINVGKPEGLTGRKKIEAFRQAYEAFREEGYLPASYEIYYVVVQAVLADSDEQRRV